MLALARDPLSSSSTPLLGTQEYNSLSSVSWAFLHSSLVGKLWVWRSIHALKENVGVVVVAEISLAEGLSFTRWHHIGILKKNTSHFIFLPNHCRRKVHPQTDRSSHGASSCSGLLRGSDNYIDEDSGCYGHIVI